MPVRMLTIVLQIFPLLLTTDERMSNDGFSFGISGVAIAMLLIAFWGEPDLIDALIHFLMNQ